jgi:hypothetical protein
VGDRRFESRIGNDLREARTYGMSVSRVKLNGLARFSDRDCLISLENTCKLKFNSLLRLCRSLFGCAGNLLLNALNSFLNSPALVALTRPK